MFTGNPQRRKPPSIPFPLQFPCQSTAIPPYPSVRSPRPLLSQVCEPAMMLAASTDPHPPITTAPKPQAASYTKPYLPGTRVRDTVPISPPPLTDANTCVAVTDTTPDLLEAAITPNRNPPLNSPFTRPAAAAAFTPISQHSQAPLFPHPYTCNRKRIRPRPSL